jgi:hypothetical protein
MPIIDAHTHLYPPEVNAAPAAWAAARGEAHWATLCARARKSGRPVQGFPSVADFLRAMDAADVERAVLLGWYWENPGTCAWQNRFYAECLRRHADRFSAFAALHRHFFGGGDARPVISSLQNRNRLLIQVRALVDAGDLRPGPRGFSKTDLDRAAAAYGRHFTGATEKSAYNLFTQHPFYLGKLAGARKPPDMHRLINNQMELVRAFEEINHRPAEQEDVLRELAVRCLGA